MLDWIFGSKKSEKSEEKKEEKKSQSEENKLGADEKWVYDFIRQYLTSPIWRNPLLDLMEENCSIFEDSEENKFQYTKVFQEFTGLAALLLETMIDETGVTEKQLQKCILKGMKSQKDSKIFQQILICDNFESFKKIMVSKNKELELEALKKLHTQKKQSKDQGQIAIDIKELERIEIEKAIAMSLAMESKANEQQEKQLEEALRLSHIEYEKEEIKKTQVSKITEQKQKKPFQSLPPLIGTSKPYKPIQQFKAEQSKLKEEIEILKKKQEERRIKENQQKESTEERKKRLQEQRELIRKKKQEQRKEELTSFVENKQSATGPAESKVSEEEMERRRNLMKKLKEQLKD